MSRIHACRRSLNRGAVQIERLKQLRFVAGSQRTEKEQCARLEKERNLECVVMSPKPHASTSLVIAPGGIRKCQHASNAFHSDGVPERQRAEPLQRWQIRSPA